MISIMELYFCRYFFFFFGSADTLELRKKSIQMSSKFE